MNNRPSFSMILLMLAAFMSAMVAHAHAQITNDLPMAEVELRFPSLEIGELGKLVIEFEGFEEADTARVQLPPDQGNLIRVGEGTIEDNTFVAPVWLLVSGQREIGPFALHLREDGRPIGTVRTGTTQLDVPPPGAELSLPDDFTQPIAPPVNWARIAVIAAVFLVVGLALLAALIFLLRRMMKNRPAASAKPEPLVAPIEEARLALSTLAQLSVFKAHGSKAHYSRLSEALRRYLERQYSIPALEMTEDEVAEFILHKYGHDSAARELKSLFAHSSMAKFARWESTEDAAAKDVLIATSFLDSEERAQQLEEELRRRASQTRGGGKEQAA